MGVFLPSRNCSQLKRQRRQRQSAKQQNVSMTFDADIEVITHDVHKIQFANSGTVLMSRPDKLRSTRTGG